MEEFFRQGDKEQELGLDFSPLCDRQTTVVPQSQIGLNECVMIRNFKRKLVLKALLISSSRPLLTCAEI